MAYISGSFNIVAGYDGAKMRMRDWVEGEYYVDGNDGEEFYDVVVFRERLYLCVNTVGALSKLGVNDPVTSENKHLGFWEHAQDWAFVATKLLLTERIKAEQIDTKGLVVEQLATAHDGPRVVITGTTMKIFGQVLDNIRFGINKDGMSVMEYYDNDGRLLYDLGPGGINTVPKDNESWVKRRFIFLSQNEDDIFSGLEWEACKNPTYSKGADCYQYFSSHVGGAYEDAANHMCFYVSNSKSENKILDGYYVECRGNRFGDISEAERLQQQYDSRTGSAPDDIDPRNPYVNYSMTVYLESVMYIKNGKLTSRKNVYFNIRKDGGIY